MAETSFVEVPILSLCPHIHDLAYPLSQRTSRLFTSSIHLLPSSSLITQHFSLLPAYFFYNSLYYHSHTPATMTNVILANKKLAITKKAALAKTTHQEILLAERKL